MNLFTCDFSQQSKFTAFIFLFNYLLNSTDLLLTDLSFYQFKFKSGVLEKSLEKKAGRNYGPPGNKKLIYFIDDMNMPEVDTYGTVQPHTLIRQNIDYKHW